MLTSEGYRRFCYVVNSAVVQTVNALTLIVEPRIDAVAELRVPLLLKPVTALHLRNAVFTDLAGGSASEVTAPSRGWYLGKTG